VGESKSDRIPDTRLATGLVTARALGDTGPAARVTADFAGAACVVAARRAHRVTSARRAGCGVTGLPVRHTSAAARIAAAVARRALRRAARFRWLVYWRSLGRSHGSSGVGRRWRRFWQRPLG
jgi:hypothetical protein